MGEEVTDQTRMAFVDRSENVGTYEENMELIHEYSGNLPCFDEVKPKIFASEDAEILIYGKPRNWKEDFHDHTNIFLLLRNQEIHQLYYPNVSGFTGTICEDKDFPESFEMSRYDLRVFRHYQTDGMIIPNKSAGFMCTADCPVVVFHDLTGGRLIMAHAGLSSLIDRQEVLTGQKSRNDQSVVNDIRRYIDDLDQYEIFVLCGISYESFIYSIDHPVFGKSNAKILDYLINRFGSNTVPLGKKHGGISLNSIIRNEFSNCGIDPEKIFFDEINTFSDPNFWSHAESTQKHGNDGRNGILVIHR